MIVFTKFPDQRDRNSADAGETASVEFQVCCIDSGLAYLRRVASLEALVTSAVAFSTVALASAAAFCTLV